MSIVNYSPCQCYGAIFLEQIYENNAFCNYLWLFRFLEFTQYMESQAPAAMAVTAVRRGGREWPGTSLSMRPPSPTLITRTALRAHLSHLTLPLRSVICCKFVRKQTTPYCIISSPILFQPSLSHWYGDWLASAKYHLLLSSPMHQMIKSGKFLVEKFNIYSRPSQDIQFCHIQFSSRAMTFVVLKQFLPNKM